MTATLAIKMLTPLNFAPLQRLVEQHVTPVKLEQVTAPVPVPTHAFVVILRTDVV